MPFKNPKDRKAWGDKHRLANKEKYIAWRKEYYKREKVKQAPLLAIAAEKRVRAREKKKRHKEEQKQQRVEKWNAIKDTCRMCGDKKPEEFKVSKSGSRDRLCRKCRNIEKMKSQKKGIKNRPEVYRAAWKRHYEKVKRDPIQLIKTRIRGRIQQAVRNIGVGVSVKSGKFRYLGCTGEEAARYLQQQFKGCMSWDNYGSAWHIDHVFPLASYDLSKEENRIKAFHYTNLQPLWAKANVRKSDTIPDKPHQPRLLLT